MIKFSSIDFVKIALDRLSMHYHDRPRCKAYLKALISLFLDLQNVALGIPKTYDIDTAQGVDLDMIGDILGFSRYYSLQLTHLKGLFGLDEEDRETQSLGLSEEDDDTIGGYWLEEGQGQQSIDKLPDDLYRLFLKAKTLTNHTKCTLEEIIQVFKTLFPNEQFSLIKESPMNLVIKLHKSNFQGNVLSLIETTDIIPRGAGVSLMFEDFGT